MATTEYLPNLTVDRPALWARLDRALSRRLTVVVGSAGAGKSVLLSQWVQQHPQLPVAWLSLTAADDDAAHLARHLMTELAGVQPSLPDIAGLASLGDGGLGEPFIGELVDGLSHDEVCLVFDDFHVLSNTAAIADLERLIGAVPSNVHVVLASRTDLPSSLNRYRLLDQLTEIRQGDLAMSHDESAQLLANTIGHALSAENVSALVDKTEGWAAGLQLAGLTISLRDDPDEFIRDFSGSDRFVGDYLSHEVLASVSASDRESILRLAALDTMSSELIRASIDDPDARLLFEQLARNTQFVIALDARREWFRFHHLFRDLLRFNLQAEQPETERAIAERAAAWHLDNGDAASAVEYLLRVRLWSRALEVILSRGSEMFERQEVATIITWLEAIPSSVREQNLDSSLTLGVLLGLVGQNARSEDILSKVVNDPRASRGQVACGLTCLSILVVARPNPRRSIRDAQQALDLLAALDEADLPNVLGLSTRNSLETLALAAGGRGHFLNGNFAEARRWMNRTVTSDGARYALWRINALGDLALLEGWSGNLVRANELAMDALETARGLGLLVHWASASAYLALALIAIERGEPVRAPLSLHEALLRAEPTHRTQQLWLVWCQNALLLEASNEVPPHAVPDGAPPPVVVERQRAMRLRQRRRDGSAEHHDDVARSITGRASEVLFELALDAFNRHRTDDFDQVLDQISAEDDGSEAARTVQRLLLVSLQRGPRKTGTSASPPVRNADPLREAVSLAQREGLVELFVRGGPAIISLVATSTDSDPAFRARILDRAREAQVPIPGSDLQEPLTRREREILSYLPSRYSNNDLAEMSFVSISTIKTHLLHIYQKLGVVNRKGAVERARELGLL